MISRACGNPEHIIHVTCPAEPRYVLFENSVNSDQMASKEAIRLGSKMFTIQLVCLFDLILYVPSTIFQFNRDGSSRVKPVLSQDKCV